MSLAVSILGRKKPAVRVTHFPGDIVKGLLNHASETTFPRKTPTIQINADELRIVVKHLLEMRDEPLTVHRIAVKPSLKMVIDPARGHCAQGMFHLLPR